jgi:hypothetical protein
LAPPIRAAVLARSDADSLRSLFNQQPDHLSLRDSADALLRQNLTDSAEISRVLGPS